MGGPGVCRRCAHEWTDGIRDYERIYDVALSDGRQPDPETGDVPPVGNTVDVTTAAFTNDIGAPELKALWTDPDFTPGQEVVYYVRVLEFPALGSSALMG